MRQRLTLSVLLVAMVAACGTSSPVVGAASDASIEGGSGELPDAIACKLFATAAQVEAMVIVPKCGRPGDPICHSAAGAFPPRIEAGGAAAMNLLDVRPMQNCRNDKLVDRADPERSFFLAKTRATGATARCSDGGNGGPKMPYQDAPPLTAEESACLRWWVHEIAKAP